jgi:hypothetical protein
VFLDGIERAVITRLMRRSASPFAVRALAFQRNIAAIIWRSSQTTHRFNQYGIASLKDNAPFKQRQQKI